MQGGTELAMVLLRFISFEAAEQELDDHGRNEMTTPANHAVSGAWRESLPDLFQKRQQAHVAEQEQARGDITFVVGTRLTKFSPNTAAAMESDELRARQGVAFVGRRHHREIQRGPGGDLTIGIGRDEAQQGNMTVLMAGADKFGHPGQQLLTASDVGHAQVAPIESE